MLTYFETNEKICALIIIIIDSIYSIFSLIEIVMPLVAPYGPLNINL